MNRRSFFKVMTGNILAIIGLGSGIYYYAREIEPGMLNINQEVISSNKVPASFDNFKIVQFSDTHVGFHYSIEQLNKLITEINDQNPDVIVFTGDLIDKPQYFDQTSELINSLSSLQATKGKFWVYGNHDHGGYGTTIIRNIMEGANFQLLKNEHTLIEHHNEHIVMSGIDDVLLGRPNIEKALVDINPNLFTILLAHEPDIADITSQFPVDVQLSGHSHGGQIRFPFIGHLYTPAYAKKYVQGKYVFKNEGMLLYVNSGIGTTQVPLRFLCKPEIHSFTLKHI